MLKRNKSLVISILLIAIIMTIVVVANAASKWEMFGSSYWNINNDADKNKVIAKLNGEEITKKEFEGKKVFLSTLNSKEPSPREIMEEIVSQKILIIEAKKLNLYPSRNETLAYMENIKSVKAEAKKEGIKIDEESEKSWQEALKGQRMTEDEYWKSEDTINGYQEALAIAKVRSKLAKDWGFSEDEMVTPDGIDKFEKELDNMVNERKNNLKLEYLESGFTN